MPPEMRRWSGSPRCCASNCGPGVIAARLGGEEFVIADIASPERHAQIVERIRVGIAELPVQITASLGTCAAEIDGDVEAEHPQFLDQLIGAADAAMYRSKRAGGNRVQHRHAGLDLNLTVTLNISYFS